MHTSTALILVLNSLGTATTNGEPDPVWVQQEIRVCGVVRDARDRAPVFGAAVRAIPQAPVTLSREDGTFCLEGLRPGTVRLGAERIGLMAQPAALELRAGDALEIELLMAPRAIELPGIVVTSQSVDWTIAPGTLQRIERAAVEHLQASSLADVLQLLPGQLATNPTLSGPRQSLLRQVPTTADAARANALGTSLVVDGVPWSNNANLQTDVTILNSGPGTLPPFASVAGRGVDLRTISPDEIESVEVIQGVPGVRFGDVTTGVIQVQTRIGARAPEVRLRANPNMLDVGITRGWGGVVPGSHGWGMTGNLAASQDDPRQTLDNFYRATTHLAWRSPRGLPGIPETSIRLQFWSTLDERRRDPDDLRNQIERESIDQGLRLTWDGGWSPERRTIPEVHWNFSMTASRQEGRYQSLVGRSITPITPAVADTMMFGTYGPSEYLNVTTVQGRPRQGYGRVETLWRMTGRPVRSIRVGGEWRHEENRGEGRQFDLATPPRQNYNVGDRPRSYRDTPPLQQVSLYAEAQAGGRLPHEIGTLVLTPGLRVDRVGNSVHPFGGSADAVIQPRINLGLRLAGGWAVRAGAGRLATTPPLTFLHPGPRYFDLINLNYFSPNPEHRRLLMTTRVVEPEPLSARPFLSDKAEVGFETPGAQRLGRGRITAFWERTTGAPGWDRELVLFPVDRFEVETPFPGGPPVIRPEPFRVDTFYSAYDRPSNTRNIWNQGIEFDIDLPEWPRLKTTALLSGAWTRTRATNTSQALNTGAFYFSSVPPQRVGVYRNDGQEGERLVTSLRLIHRAPEVGLVLSGLIQTLWMDRARRTDVDPFPLGYVDRTGVVTPLTPDAARSTAFQDLVRPVSEAYLAQDRPPPLWLLNLRLSKTLPAGMEASLFVNNVLASRPLHEDPRTLGFVRRNPPLFFGMELVSRLGASSR
jgi:hypothetical protein